MSLQELRAFLRVVDEGSFLAAATKLGVSRSTLRRHVDALEQRAGVRLLDRSAKGVVLTEAGRRLVGGGRAIELEFSVLLDAVKETEELPKGEVRAVLPVGLPPQAIAGIVGMLRANWPGVTVHARHCDAPQSSRVSGVDLMVWFGETGPPGAWEVREVQTLRQHLVATPSYLAARGTPQKPKDLEDHDLFAWVGPGETEPRLVMRDGGSLPMSATLVSNDPHVLHEAAQMGLGLAWVPDGGIVPPPGREACVPVLDTLCGRDVPLRLGVPRALAEVPKVRLFLEHFRELRSAADGH